MKVKDMMKKGGRIYFKSDWEPISDIWPCFSFTKEHVGKFLQKNYKIGHDVVIYVGTSSPRDTKNPQHRQRLISVTSIDPSISLPTHRFLSKETWEKSVQKHGPKKWQYSVPVNKAANFIGPPFPSVFEYIPKTYKEFSPKRGNVIGVHDEEFEAVYNLEIELIVLKRTSHAINTSDFKHTISEKLDKDINADITRMTDLIINRVSQSGKSIVKTNPHRTESNFVDTFQTILSKWMIQNGKCGLCNGKLYPKSSNELLQSSIDRIDSNNIAYNKENISITHLGCNLAKNQFSNEKFNEWLKIISSKN